MGESPDPGRPSKFTEETRRTLLLHLRKGVSIRRSCKLAGIDESTYYRWRRNRHGDPVAERFFEEQVPKARNQQIAKAHEVLDQGMNMTDDDGNPTGQALSTAKWYLSNYGGEDLEPATQKVEHKGKMRHEHEGEVRVEQDPLATLVVENPEAADDLASGLAKLSEAEAGETGRNGHEEAEAA